MQSKRIVHYKGTSCMKEVDSVAEARSILFNDPNATYIEEICFLTKEDFWVCNCERNNIRPNGIVGCKCGAVRPNKN